MRNLIIVSMFIFCSCSSYDFKISELKHENLKFSDLPVVVKDFLMQPPQFDNENPSSLIFINSKEADRYVFEVIFNTWVSSWVDYMKLFDIKNKVSYRIDQGVPSPFFVYENKLYMPNKFNIFNMGDDINNVQFTCYILK